MSQKDLGRRAALNVKFNNTDITSDINENLISLTYTDASEDETDDLKIVIHDRDAKWVKDWLKKELEQRDQANADIARGVYSSTASGTANYTVTAKIGLNVRTGRGTSYKKLGALKYGATVEVYGIVDGWAEIRYSGQTAYCSASYLKLSSGSAATGQSSSSGQSWSIGEEVLVTGRARSNSYGKNAKIGYQVNNRAGKITYLNLKSGIPYPIHVDSLGWFAESCVTKKNQPSQAESQDGSQTSNAKYTKINAVITAQNVDGSGTDRVLDCGKFELDNVRFTAPPMKVEMSATSLSYESTIRKVKKTRSWSKTSLKKIASSIATAGGYNLLYSSSFDPTYSYILQSDLSDIEFLSGQCKAAGLRLKVTDGILVIYDAKDYDEKTAIETITMGDGSYDTVSLESALAMAAYSSCHVSYEDDQGNSYEATFTPSTAYSEGEVLEVTEQVGSNKEAMELAKRRLRAANKGEITGKFKMAGDPRLVAGNNIQLKGFGDFDGKYSIDKSVHKVPPYTTEIEISKVVEGY